MCNFINIKNMNKKRFLALSFAAIAIVSGYAGVKAFRSQACRENDLLAQNIEALSEDEGQEKIEEENTNNEISENIDEEDNLLLSVRSSTNSSLSGHLKARKLGS